MTEEAKMKESLKDLFEKCGITDESIKDNVINKLFEARVIWELLPEIKVDMQKLENIRRGNRGCLIYDGRYYYILPYNGKAFGCTPDKEIAIEDFQKFESGEEI